jgi:putative sterol carrier protein
LTEVKGVVEFCIAVPKGPPERYAVAFDGVGVAVVPPDEHPADVVLAMAALDFVRLVSGGVNAAILVLGDRLEITGDELLALRVGGVFQVPGRSGVAVDPSAVDPEQAAAATKHVKNAHLERVMAGGLRDVVIDQVVQRLPEFLDETKAAGQRLVIGFHIGGRPDGGHDRVLVRVEEGRCEAERLPSPDGGETAGVRAEDRDATLVLGGAQFVKLVLGHLNPVTAVVRGSLKVKGDLHAALALHRVMRIPGSH